MTMRRPLATLLIWVASCAMADAADTVHLYAAGSLKAALTEAAQAFEASSGAKVTTVFGASGLLRERIENGEKADVFASANMKHPQTLAAAGRAGPVRLFARNRLCALAQKDVTVTSDTLLDTLLDQGIRVGTSTPRADPSGDYAWELFRKAEAARPGAFATLDAKALKLTGGPDSAKAPEGRNQYGWVMENDRADVFLTYCTNAVLAKKQVADLQIVQIPDELAVGADYGLTVLTGAGEAASRLADFILSEKGQGILASYGFDPAQ